MMETDERHLPRVCVRANAQGLGKWKERMGDNQESGRERVGQEQRRGGAGGMVAAACYSPPCGGAEVDEVLLKALGEVSVSHALIARWQDASGQGDFWRASGTASCCGHWRDQPG